MKIAHLTDLHLRRRLPGTEIVPSRLSRRAPALLKQAAAEIRAEAPDLVVLSGDLLDFPGYARRDPELRARAREDLRFIAEVLNGIGRPFVVVHGNHDDPELTREIFGRPPADWTVAGMRVVCFFDDEDEFCRPRRLEAEREKFLAAVADRNSPPQIHVQHYLVWPEDNKGWPYSYREARDLRNRIVAGGRVRLVLSGHKHRGVPPQAEEGTYFAVAPALCVPPHRFWLYELNKEEFTCREKILTNPDRPRQKVVFLDRDGTLNPQPSYTWGPEPFSLLPGVREAAAKLKAHGFALVVITNQSCVGLGYVTEETVGAVNDKMAALLGEEAELDGVYCSHHTANAVLPEYLRADHPDVKPNPGLLRRAAEDLHLDLAHAYMIGDRASDLETGHRIGACPVLVKTGDGEKTAARLQEGEATFVAANLAEAAAWIIAREKK